MIMIFLILSLSINLITGFTGLITLSHAAFFGVGAYISSLLMVQCNVNFIPSLVIAVMGCALLALVIGYPALRLKGDYFILGTMGFQVIIFTILYNWIPVTRGPYGIGGIPNPQVFGLGFDNPPKFFLLSVFLAGVVLFFVSRLYVSPFGRALKAIREDEIAVLALGKNVVHLKTTAFVIGSGIAAISGALYASYVNYIDPTSFTLMESVLIVSIILVGGSGNIKGPVVGTFFVILLPEVLRFIGMPNAIAANIRQIIFGLALVLFMLFRPKGIAGEYKLD
jgi:branched-chain amino acid transport system permease protein